MSSTESSGAPAEGTATTPASDAAFPTFGTTRGSGLARGKRSTASAATNTTIAAAGAYKPTAIEVVEAPREYTNPFAPATPEASAPEAATPVPVTEAMPNPVDHAIVTPAAELTIPPAHAERFEAKPDEPAQLNILPPAEQRSTPHQTWESEGFRPNRGEGRSERPRREEPPADEPVDIDSIPKQFLYVRPGVTFVPTPRNWGGAPRERREPRTDSPDSPRREERSRPVESSAPAASAPAPAKSGGFVGWLKSLFGGSSTPEPVAASSQASEEPRRDGPGGQRRHRGGRGGRGGQGGEGGGHRRRGGRGRGRPGGGGDSGPSA